MDPSATGPGARDPATYGPETYGQAIADLYDDWYSDVSDVAGTVELVKRLAGGGPVLELGIGTGRIALPLGAAGVEVHGVDASAAMIEQLRAKPDGASIPVLLGDFSQELPGVPGGFSVVFAAFNTFVNLTSDVAMANCLALVARQLRPGGALVLENALPADDPATSGVDARRVTPDQVVLSAFRRDGAVVHGSLIALSADGVRLCPWTVRLTPPEELAALASAAGFDEEARHGGWRNEPLNAGTTRYVVVFRLRRTTVA